jgi:hypothetical protein
MRNTRAKLNDQVSERCELPPFGTFQDALNEPRYADTRK